VVPLEYKHVTLIWSLEGLSPTKFISELKGEGFEGLYSTITPLMYEFFGKEDPFSKYPKIISHIDRDNYETKEGERVIDTGEEIVVIDNNGKFLRRYDKAKDPLSFGELFRNKKYKNLIFALDDDSYTIHDPKSKKTRMWLSCWSIDKVDTPLEEPLTTFLNAILKASGCDQAVEKVVDSDTFSLSHIKMIEELKDYNLKQTMFEEQKDIFHIISDDIIREILIEFNKKHNILLSEFVKKGEDKASLEHKLNFLSGKGLLEKNLIVICNKTNQWWNMTIPSKEMLKELEKSGIKCSSCGASITEERIDNLYKISEKGAQLVNGSYWMVGRVVDTLQKLGIRNKDIFADILYEGDQIDLLALSMVHWLVFELKDREFGLGDAYKFHGKVSRLRQKASDPIVPIVITTKTIAAEARKLLSEVGPGRGDEYAYAQRPPHSEYIFVEGLENIESMLGKWVSEKRDEKIKARVKGVIAKFPARRINELNS
jgi:hypothetical protein